MKMTGRDTKSGQQMSADKTNAARIRQYSLSFNANTSGAPTAVKSIRLHAQAQKNRDINIIVTGLIAEDNCIAVCDIEKAIGVTLTDTSFKIRRFGKDNKHVV